MLVLMVCPSGLSLDQTCHWDPPLTSLISSWVQVGIRVIICFRECCRIVAVYCCEEIQEVSLGQFHLTQELIQQCFPEPTANQRQVRGCHR